MKPTIKDLLVVFTLCFVGSFMIFIYEPFLMYASNIDDFWFDLETVWPTLILTFLISLLASFSLLSLLYFVCRKFNQEKLFQRGILVLTGIFICCYIHSNFLSDFLPTLDGGTIDWSDKWGGISSIIVCVVVAVAVIILCFKSSWLKKAFYGSGFVVCAIFLMLLTSMITTIATTDVLAPKRITVNSSMDNINLASSNTNFMILLVDAVDSTVFNKVVNSDAEYSEILQDFSYFPDTMSNYAFTDESIPSIFSGNWNLDGKSLKDYSTDSFDNSVFLNKLIENDYNANLYDVDFIWNSEKALNFRNVKTVKKEIDVAVYMEQEFKYILFKILPYQLKHLSGIEEMDFKLAKVPVDYEYFDWDDVNFYHNVLTQGIEKTDEKYFQYVHLSGGHIPFDTTVNVEKRPDENGTYEQKVTATAKIVKRYIERLKSNGVYDNSVVIIMADHGYRSNTVGRQNPILYIKGINERHDKMIVSDKQISQVDLVNTFVELMDGASSTKIFSDVPTEGRTRRFIFNGYGLMDEYESTGKAWEADKLQLTGRTFNP